MLDMILAEDKKEVISRYCNGVPIKEIQEDLISVGRAYTEDAINKCIDIYLETNH